MNTITSREKRDKYMGKIGFVNICHADYISEIADSIAGKVVNSISDMGIEVYNIENPVTSCRNAQLAGRELNRSEVDGVIIFLGTWIECPVAMALLREIEHLPVCLWGFPMVTLNEQLRSTGSYVSFAMFKGTLDRIGFKYKPVLGAVDNRDTLSSIKSFCTAATAVLKLKRTRIGLVGYTSMGIYPGTFDHVILRTKIGPEIEHMDAYSLIRMSSEVRDEDIGQVIQNLKQMAKIRDDVTDDDLVRVSKLFLTMNKLVNERDLHAINIKCQYEFSKEYGMVVCVPLSLLAENGIVSSCEGDILNTVSMTMLNYLCCQTVTYGDVINHQGEIVKLSSCGFLPYCMGTAEKCEIRKFYPCNGFKGIQNSFVMRPEKVTVMRLIEDIGSYHILYFTGQGLDTELREGYMPALDIAVDGDINKLVDNYSGQHFAICYGDISAEIEDLAGILGIHTIRA